MLKDELEKLQQWELMELKSTYNSKISKAVKKAKEFSIEIEALREVFNTIITVSREAHDKEQLEKETEMKEQLANKQELAKTLSFKEFLEAVCYVDKWDSNETEWFEHFNFYNSINNPFNDEKKRNQIYCSLTMFDNKETDVFIKGDNNV